MILAVLFVLAIVWMTVEPARIGISSTWWLVGAFVVWLVITKYKGWARLEYLDSIPDSEDPGKKPTDSESTD